MKEWDKQFREVLGGVGWRVGGGGKRGAGEEEEKEIEREEVDKVLKKM